MKIKEFFEKYHVRKSLRVGMISYLRVENDEAILDETTLVEKYKLFSGVDPSSGKPVEKRIHENPSRESAKKTASDFSAAENEESRGSSVKKK